MTSSHVLPEGLVLTRTTDVFDNDTVPAGLLRAHRVADGVWGRLVVSQGAVGFVFEDEPDDVALIEAGGHVVIPPGLRHHVELVEPCAFVVEFHRQGPSVDDGLESSGLADPVA